MLKVNIFLFFVDLYIDALTIICVYISVTWCYVLECRYNRRISLFVVCAVVIYNAGQCGGSTSKNILTYFRYLFFIKCSACGGINFLCCHGNPSSLLYPLLNRWFFSTV